MWWHGGAGLTERSERESLSAVATHDLFALEFSSASTMPNAAPSINEIVGAMLERTATAPKTVDASNRLSRAERTTREITQATKIGRAAIQRQNQIHPTGCIAFNKGSANEKPPATTAATPPTKHGTLTRDFETIMRVPAMIERDAKSVIIF